LKRGTILYKSVQILAYTDDIDIIGRSERAVVEAFTKLEEVAQKLGLVINEDKTKFMEATSEPSGKVSITINNYKFEIVKEFKYLGTIVTSDNNISAEINSRTLMANKCYYGLKNQLQSHYLSRDTKCKLYKTLIRPVITYGSESWTLNKGNTNK
jgi:hypothetical protein